MYIITPKNIHKDLLERVKEGSASDSEIAQLLVGGAINYDAKLFDRYAPIFRQANEPFEKYLRQADIEGKDVLTVAGSGDFLTWVLQNKPASISTFDVNAFTEYYQALKMGALLTLSYSEYLDFFYGVNIFSDKYFEKVLNVLPNYVREFWESLTDYFEPNEIITSPLFVQSVVTITNAQEYNTFLKDRASYMKAKEAAMKIYYAFHRIDFKEMNEIKKKFDTIFISNIVDYQNYATIFEAITKLRESLDSNLKDDGVIIASTFSQNALPRVIDPNAITRKASESIYELRIKKCRH